MWEPSVCVSGSREEHAGCVSERRPLPPDYQFKVWFADDDISDKQRTLIFLFSDGNYYRYFEL